MMKLSMVWLMVLVGILLTSYPSFSVLLNGRLFLGYKYGDREVKVQDVVGKTDYPSLLAPKPVLRIKSRGTKAYLIHLSKNNRRERSDFVSVINADSLVFIDPIPLSNVIDVAFQGNLGYFLISSGHIKVLDLGTRKHVQTIWVGSDIEEIEIWKDSVIGFGEGFFSLFTTQGKQGTHRIFDGRAKFESTIIDDRLYLTILVIHQAQCVYELGVYDLSTLSCLKRARMPDNSFLFQGGCYAFMKGYPQLVSKLSVDRTWTEEELALFASYMATYRELYRDLCPNPVKRYKNSTYLAQMGRLPQMEVMAYLESRDVLNFILSLDRPSKEAFLQSLEWQVKRKNLFKGVLLGVLIDPKFPYIKEVLTLFLEIEDPLIKNLVAGAA